MILKATEKWQVRYWPKDTLELSKRVGSKHSLLDKDRAEKAVARLQKAGVDAFMNQYVVACN